MFLMIWGLYSFFMFNFKVSKCIERKCINLKGMVDGVCVCDWNEGCIVFCGWNWNDLWEFLFVCGR